MNDQISRTLRRFEIALSNFGRSCIDMQANEKSFQAWYAACIIQEFGISRVYREIHLRKKELFELSKSNKMTESLQRGNELFPDVSVSWLPDVDVRHSKTREKNLQNAGALLRQFVIVSELKVTGSTIQPTPPKAILNDISKLYLFTQAHLSFSGRDSNEGLKCYMVILDNAIIVHKKLISSYSKEKIEKIANMANQCWENNVPKPDIVYISPGQFASRLSILREFRIWSDYD